MLILWNTMLSNLIRRIPSQVLLLYTCSYLLTFLGFLTVLQAQGETLIPNSLSPFVIVRFSFTVDR